MGYEELPITPEHKGYLLTLQDVLPVCRGITPLDSGKTWIHRVITDGTVELHHLHESNDFTFECNVLFGPQDGEARVQYEAHQWSQESVSRPGTVFEAKRYGRLLAWGVDSWLDVYKGKPKGFRYGAFRGDCFAAGGITTFGDFKVIDIAALVGIIRTSLLKLDRLRA
jgi:hypothetical protein